MGGGSSFNHFFGHATGNRRGVALRGLAFLVPCKGKGELGTKEKVKKSSGVWGIS